LSKAPKTVSGRQRLVDHYLCEQTCRCLNFSPATATTAPRKKSVGAPPPPELEPDEELELLDEEDDELEDDELLELDELDELELLEEELLDEELEDFVVTLIAAVLAETLPAAS